jgi:uncharacterized NAD-dependent epimerase/dehydratase family protein
VRLYRNDRGWRFIPVPLETAGIVADSGSQGGLFGDFDLDGDLDLALAGWKHPVRIYEQVSPFRFRENALGLSLPQGMRCNAVLPGDLDNDGDLDLLFTVRGGTNLLLINQADPDRSSAHLGEWQPRPAPLRFIEGSGDFGLQDTLDSYGGGFADYDGDGDLDLREALEGGCNIVSGLHTFLGDDAVLAEAARIHGRTLTDIRRPPTNLPIASGLARDLKPLVLLTVGTDCNVGKMTAQLQLVQGLKARGLRTNFVATGQTGIMIEGGGLGVDAVVADFIAGAAEEITVRGAEHADVVLVEGQGSINHPGYSGVTVGLLHGSCPDAMILCHQSTREFIGDYRQASWLRLPSLNEYVKAYEALAGMVSPSKVIGIALNTYDMSDDDAREACRKAAEETGLPATDPVRFDAAPLLDAIAKAHREHVAA